MTTKTFYYETELQTVDGEYQVFYKRLYQGKDWDFTGKIRYIRRDPDVPVEMELQISIPKTTWFDKFIQLFGASDHRLKWTNEVYFYEEEKEPDGQVGVMEWMCGHTLQQL